MTLFLEIWPAIRLTLTLAFVTTLILVVIGTPLAWWLARSKSRWTIIVNALIALPLVLPPTVLGFYMLILLGTGGPGGWLAPLWGGRSLAFTFPGLVIGSVLYSLPFVVQPLRNSFAAIGPGPLEAAYSLGLDFRKAFALVILPLARPGYLTAAVLGFSHTVGEFGVVMMIGGNIPGQTKVLSIAIFDYVEQLRWTEAHIIAFAMLVFAFVALALTMSADRSITRIQP
ncbi:molybdate ABC transporter permease subunit [Pelagibacterium halotolerans]|uniref:Molybdenum transport system permease n=1 Tax=Pelagibacterium halotolerans (strain DSM 22347 / JCM 15775 / CGMCC 1.7692 / B2) TaxID=1082931 RepID=G4RCV6_PELHB|nr:molybdate ABC transporter permease subunit [Pelagibacterium halotolerans]AEQ52739.1 molybdenum transport system permease protein ModB [Pelagibacterium halotolerans B2]QJR17559.1 molybdate ABC transporter permease subunit [Pelagibacterium halotolerans]SEA85282.1 molybdate transport system permease protein [Pelagibacterium halotolerans]